MNYGKAVLFERDSHAVLLLLIQTFDFTQV